MVTVAVVMAQPECLPDGTLGDSRRGGWWERGTADSEGDGRQPDSSPWLGGPWLKLGGIRQRLGSRWPSMSSLLWRVCGQAGGSRAGLQPQPLRGSLSPGG